MKKYLLNTNSKKIHLSDSKDGRCKIKEMGEEYKVYLDTLEEALAYPNSKKTLARTCNICLRNITQPQVKIWRTQGDINMKKICSIWLAVIMCFSMISCKKEVQKVEEIYGKYGYDFEEPRFDKLYKIFP